MNNWQWRDYQNSCFESIIDAYGRGITQQLVIQATGLGKRSQAVFMASKGKNSLFLAHTEELIQQAYDDFVRWYGIENVGMVRGNRNEWDKRFVVSSPLTIVNRMEKIDPYHFDVIQCDEVHHYMARLFYKAATYFKGKLWIGWTATPRRLDGLTLKDLAQEATFEYGILQGIKEGHLAELKGIRIKTNVNISAAKKTMGDFAAGELSSLVDLPERNQLIVDSYEKYASGRQFIVFCVDTVHAVNVAEAFEQRGIHVGLLVSNKDICSDAQREQLTSDFKCNRLQGIVNINIATEGFDYNNIGAILDAAPTMSESRYLQRVGRGTRLKPPEFRSLYGNNCLILDFVDLSSRHKLVNSFELDERLPAIDKVFVTSEAREKLLNAERKRRESKIVNEVAVDEYFDFMKPPKIKISKSEKMLEEATPAQIKLLQWLGLHSKTDENGNEMEYTKNGVAEALQGEILPWMKRKMIEWKYNPTGATIDQYLLISKEIKLNAEREEQARLRQKATDSLVANLERTLNQNLI